MITVKLPGAGDMALLIMLVVARINEHDSSLRVSRVVKQLLGQLAVNDLQPLLPQPRQGELCRGCLRRIRAHSALHRVGGWESRGTRPSRAGKIVACQLQTARRERIGHKCHGGAERRDQHRLKQNSFHWASSLSGSAVGPQPPGAITEAFIARKSWRPWLPAGSSVESCQAEAGGYHSTA